MLGRGVAATGRRAVIAGMGFALMAWALAQQRTGYASQPPVDLARAEPYCLLSKCDACEYYRIIDRAYAVFNSFPRGITVRL